MGTRFKRTPAGIYFRKGFILVLQLRRIPHVSHTYPIRKAQGVIEKGKTKEQASQILKE